MKHVKKLTLVGVVATTLLVSGCSDSSKQIKALEQEVEFLKTQKDRLQAEKDSMTITEESIETSLRTVEGSTVPEFHTIESKIVFPNALIIPDSKVDASKSNFLVGSTYRFTPSTNWQIRMNGATMSVSHPSKVWGEIKAITVREMVREPDMQPILQSFFLNFPATNITYRKIFMDDLVVGMMANAKITVDKKPHVVNVGFITRGETGLLFLFDYEDNNTGVQQELVDVLISSGYVGDTSLRLE